MPQTCIKHPNKVLTPPPWDPTARPRCNQRIGSKPDGKGIFCNWMPDEAVPEPPQAAPAPAPIRTTTSESSGAAIRVQAAQAALLCAAVANQGRGISPESLMAQGLIYYHEFMKLAAQGGLPEPAKDDIPNF